MYFILPFTDDSSLIRIHMLPKQVLTFKTCILHNANTMTVCPIMIACLTYFKVMPRDIVSVCTPMVPISVDHTLHPLTSNVVYMHAKTQALGLCLWVLFTCILCIEIQQKIPWKWLTVFRGHDTLYMYGIIILIHI